MSQWQPIETAPKVDGDPILLGMQGGVGEGFWHDGSLCHGHRGKAGFFWESDRDNLLTASNVYPTHWQPLPEAP